jgi:signal transduction histidine kinase
MLCRNGAQKNLICLSSEFMNRRDLTATESSHTDPVLLKEISDKKKSIELDYLKEDIPIPMQESKEGLVRVRKIVQDPKDFSHVDSTSDWIMANLNHGMDSTLNVVNNEIKYKAELVKDYADLPDVQCILSQINQVIMNLVVNAAHAIGPDRGTITVRSGVEAISSGLRSRTRDPVFRKTSFLASSTRFTPQNPSKRALDLDCRFPTASFKSTAVA